MKIIVFSDSHGNISNMQKAIELQKESIDTIIHLGDCVVDAQRLNNIIGITPLIIVSGNNDFNQSLFGKKFPDSKALELAGKRFYICHGHRQGVKSGLEPLLETAKSNKYEIVLFGHTHIPYASNENGIYLLNPGSIGRAYAKSPTYGEININNGIVDIEIKEVK